MHVSSHCDTRRAQIEFVDAGILLFMDSWEYSGVDHVDYRFNCAGCGKKLGSIRWLMGEDVDELRNFELLPGYYRNAAGVYIRPRPPRRAPNTWRPFLEAMNEQRAREGKDPYPADWLTACVATNISTDTPIIVRCPSCPTRVLNLIDPRAVKTAA